MTNERQDSTISVSAEYARLVTEETQKNSGQVPSWNRSQEPWNIGLTRVYGEKGKKFHLRPIDGDF